MRWCRADRIFSKFKAVHNRKICIRSARNKLNPHFLKAVKSLGLTSIDQIEPHPPIGNHVGNRMDTLMRVAGDDWSLAKNESSSILCHGFGSFTRLPSLPNYCSEGEHDRPCSDSFWPCYESAPPLRPILVGLLIVASRLIVGYGWGWNIHLLCVTLVFPCILLSDWLLLLGHRWHCEGKDSDQNYISQYRDGKTLAQSRIANNLTASSAAVSGRTGGRHITLPPKPGAPSSRQSYRR